MHFKVRINRISQLPQDFCSNVFVEYKFYLDEQVYRTKVVRKDRNPVFNFEQIHHVDCVTKQLINYLLNDKLTFKIYANQDLEKKTKKVESQSSTLQKSTQN
jgi:Ca2+-dependent lipid-binding protein